MECRENCGACCIAPSIASSIPNMEKGKPAGVRCIQLDENNMCKIFKDPKRPKVCEALKPCKDMCKNNREEAMKYLTELEKATSPDK